MERATITSSALGTVTCCRGGSHGFQENIAGISLIHKHKVEARKKGRKLFESVGSICNLFYDLAQTRRYHVMK